MENKLRYLILGIILALILWLFLFPKGCSPASNSFMIVKTDTVFVNKPYKEIVIKEVVKPTKVFIYKTDTTLRKKVEKDTLLNGIEFRPKEVKIHTLTPKGTPLIKHYPLHDIKTIEIDHKGNAQIKQKKHTKIRQFFRRFGIVAVFSGGVYLGVKISQ